MSAVAFRERPIIFSGPMVRSILDGRKTQTRRVIATPKDCEPDWEPLLAADGSCNIKWMSFPLPGVKMGRTKWLRCPFGRPGERLWVREKWWVAELEGCGIGKSFLVYDDEWRQGPYGAKEPSPATFRHIHPGPASPVPKWGPHPSIHMPRWASRLTLEIVSVRVERVQDISGEDALAEGVDWLLPGHGPVPREAQYQGAASYRDGFELVWDAINAKRGFSFASNPWIWALEFRRVNP